MEEIVAFIFISPTHPTNEMHKRLPSFVRRNKVRRVLEWLELNHNEYSDLSISHENVEQYPESDPPLIEDYRPDWVANELENKASYDVEDWSFVEEGKCSLIVHTLTLDKMMAQDIDFKTLQIVAKAHVLQGSRTLAIGRSADPESIYGNSQMYPKVFPWLFSYGLGGIGNKDSYSSIGDLVKKTVPAPLPRQKFPERPYLLVDSTQS